jgi:acyl carrier protein
MDPDLAVKALGQALGGSDSVLAVMDVDWAQFASAPSAFVRDLPEVRELSHQPGGSAGDLAEAGLARQLAGLPQARQVQVMTDLIRAGAAEVLGHASAEAVEPDRAFSDLGFDSLTSLEMRQHLNIATGLRLPATLLFDYPTPAILAEYLWAGIFDLQTDHLPVLEELGRLAELLSSVTRNDGGRAEIAARLEAITQAFHAVPEDAAMERELEAATNDEMFDLVEEELRNSELD